VNEIRQLEGSERVARSTRTAQRVTAALVALAIFSAGCGRGLSNSYDSPEALARAVLDALESKDRVALEALWVTRAEHRELLWDQLPESKSLPFEYARRINEINSRKGIENAIHRYGGQRFELISIEFSRPAEKYDGFTVHFGTRLRVRRAKDGREGELPILDVVLEHHGRWKLMNFEDR
jgi:hypothetical protein